MTFTSNYNFRERMFAFIRAYSRIWMGFALVVIDFFSLLASGSIAVYIWSHVRPELYPPFYVTLIPLIFIFIVVYAYGRLYPGIGLSPVEEVRRLTISNTFVFFCIGTLSFWFRNSDYYSRASFILSWVFALFFVPIARELLRKFLSRMGLWGEPVAIIGFESYGQNILKFLLKNPEVGLCPVVVIHGCNSLKKVAKKVPTLKSDDLSSEKRARELLGVQTAIVVKSEVPRDFLNSIVEEQNFGFTNIIMVSDIEQIGRIWVTPEDIGGILGLRIRQNLLSKWQQLFKRSVDIGLIIISGPILFPLLGFIGLLIKLDSRGNVFYTQPRIGQGGREIDVWKFRTMIPDAEEVLDRYLKANPQYKEEWEKTQKLKHDPRVTGIGKVLRRLSFDELPQLWNVVIGNMSLVGPRPIVKEEIENYGSCFNLYKQVKPGITGLWQVSGRNDVSYYRRVRMDEYYVRNWSIWMDLYILVKTIFVVLSGKGAY